MFDGGKLRNHGYRAQGSWEGVPKKPFLDVLGATADHDGKLQAFLDFVLDVKLGLSLTMKSLEVC
jgi:hypothetical protein